MTTSRSLTEIGGLGAMLLIAAAIYKKISFFMTVDKTVIGQETGRSGFDEN
jgi:hypothetical protein